MCAGSTAGVALLTELEKASMFALGYDIGSSSIKCSIIEIESGATIAQGFYPSEEMKIESPQPGFAEQDPELWWQYVKLLTRQLISGNKIDAKSIRSIGISYQMHGLVIVDKQQHVLRPAIIWCDSRAVDTGNKAIESLGADYCLPHLLNSPGNFTASKLRWVQQYEPEVFKKIDKAMLPGDYIAMKLTGEITSTISGLSEGIFWDYQSNGLSNVLLEYYGIDEALLPPVRPTFSNQGMIAPSTANELGLSKEVVVSYRAGDQPNNAFSLNVLQPGEIAATAGTSGVVYGIIDQYQYDPLSRVNQFAHVNHSVEQPRLGVLLCINGTGIQNSWLRKNIASSLSYNEINQIAGTAPVGSDGVVVLPFGNGAERVLENKNIGSLIDGLDFNRHTKAHVLRAAQEGIAFAFKYGIDIMKEMGLHIKVIRAGHANMFLSPIFCNTLSTVTDAAIELYNTDGAAGAARGSAIGAGYYTSSEEAFRTLKKIQEVTPDRAHSAVVAKAYNRWLGKLKASL
jgi:xylulokinase